MNGEPRTAGQNGDDAANAAIDDLAFVHALEPAADLADMMRRFQN